MPFMVEKNNHIFYVDILNADLQECKNASIILSCIG